jgi:hypothetical protein
VPSAALTSITACALALGSSLGGIVVAPGSAGAHVDAGVTVSDAAPE